MIPVKPAIAHRAHVRSAARGVPAAVSTVDRRPGGFWQKQAEIPHLVPSAAADLRRRSARGGLLPVRRRTPQRLPQPGRPALETRRRRRFCGPGRARRLSLDHLPRAQSGLPHRQRAARPRRDPGDRVALYMPMIPELAATMLACARIGAVHSVVFAGFSAESLRGRILDGSQARRHRQRRPAAAASGSPSSPRSTGAVAEARLRQRRCGRPAHRHRGADAGRARFLAGGGVQPPALDLSGGVDARRVALFTLIPPARPASPGRPAHHRRISGLCGDDPQAGLRPHGRTSISAPRTSAG